MFNYIIGGAIVASAAILLYRNIRSSIRGEGCACGIEGKGCSGCSHRS